MPAIDAPAHRPPTPTGRWTRTEMAALALATAALALLTTKALVHWPLGALALAGVVALVRSPDARMLGRRLAPLAAAIWLPMLASLPDAVDRGHALEVTLAYPHLPLAALAIGCGLRRHCRALAVAAAALAVAWSLDASWQYLNGRDLLGYPYDGTILKGMFYPKQRLALVLAVLAPVVLEATARLGRRTRWAWLVLLPYVLVIGVSGKRSAWVMLAVAVVLVAAWMVRAGRTPLRRAAAIVTVIAAVGVGGLVADPVARSRAWHTIDALAPDHHALDEATAGRWSLWRTAGRMAASHWLNGVGVRGFRHAYAEYASREDFWMTRFGHGQTHPHQMALEVAAETGVPGLVAYLALWAWLLARLLREPASRGWAAAWLAACATAWFPGNAHLAFYGSYWSALAWLCLAGWLACSGPSSSASQR